MAEQKYSKRESLNRILRLLSDGMADVSTQAPETVPPPYYSEDEAVSLISELLGGTLEGDSATLPSSMNATITVPGVVKLPEFGAIYASTGSAVMSVGVAYTKITGTFQSDGISTANIVNDYANDKITINATGTYFIAWRAEIIGDTGITYQIRPYLDSVAHPELTAGVSIAAAVLTKPLSNFGFFIATGTSMDLELYVSAFTGSSSFQLNYVSLTIFRLLT